MGKDSNWGYEAHLTSEQRDVLGQLRAKVKNELPPKEYLQRDSSLLRYLRARNFNLQKTWTMLTEDVEWRDPFEGYVFERQRDFGGAYALHEQGAIRMAGRARNGSPVLSVLARGYNPRLVEDNLQIVYFFVFYIDAVCRMAEEAGEETFFGLFDLEGFSLSNFSLPQISLAISILQNHYPERLGGVFIIGAPWAFTAVWKMIRPLLDERTRNKISILGKDYLEALTEHVDLDQLEQQYGGTHAKYAVPDEIVQVALDNEKKRKDADEQQQKQQQQQQATAALPAALPMSSSASSYDLSPRAAGPVSSPSSASFKTANKTKQGRVKQLVRKMMFLSDKRKNDDNDEDEGGALAVASSSSYVLSEPLSNSPDELASAALTSEIEKLSKSLVESRVEQDRFMQQVEQWRQVHDNTLTQRESHLRFLQLQILCITLMALGGALMPYVFPQ